MLTYDVVVPVYDRYDMTFQMLTCLQNSTVKPANIFMFDNGSTDETPTLVYKFPDLPIRYHHSDKNLGVNPAWNYCMNLVQSDIVAILNNDILFPDYTIEFILEAFRRPSNIGLCIPHEVKKKSELTNTKPELPIVKPRSKFYPGFHYFIRKDLWLDIGPIPDGMLLWYGDSYIWGGVLKHGKINVECLNAPIFHYSRSTWNNHKTECDLMLQGDHKAADDAGMRGLFAGIGRYSFGYDRITPLYFDGSAQISIGAFCSIGQNIRIYLGGNHNTNWVSTYPFGHINQAAFPYHGRGHPSTNGSVVVEDDTWIGDSCTIMSGVTVGA